MLLQMCQTEFKIETPQDRRLIKTTTTTNHWTSLLVLILQNQEFWSEQTFYFYLNFIFQNFEYNSIQLYIKLWFHHIVVLSCCVYPGKNCWLCQEVAMSMELLKEAFNLFILPRNWYKIEVIVNVDAYILMKDADKTTGYQYRYWGRVLYLYS